MHGMMEMARSMDVLRKSSGERIWSLYVSTTSPTNYSPG
jgi:hypothetical protein